MSHPETPPGHVISADALYGETPAPAAMQDELLRLVVCPVCGRRFTLEASHRDDGVVVEGWLRCPCGRSYPILRGIPRLLEDWPRLYPSLASPFEPPGAASPGEGGRTRDRMGEFKRRTQRQFGFQWTVFHQMSCDFWENFFTSVGPVAPDFFRGKTGLDAGCGFGRHLIQAVRCGARMIGMDYSRAIESSHRNTRDTPGIALVQADIERMPFQPACFDFAYSIGVLHHLPEPFRGFDALVRQVKPGGAVIVWCYSDRRRWTIRTLSALRFFTTRLPLHPLRWLSVGLALGEWMLLLLPFRLLLAGRLKTLLARKWPRLAVYAPYPLQVACADWFDRLAAPVRHYLSLDELNAWCARTGLRRARITPTGLYGWTLYAERPGDDGH